MSFTLKLWKESTLRLTNDSRKNKYMQMLVDQVGKGEAITSTSDITFFI